eukprot:Gb_07495 [translate_table: standard]
MGLSKYCILVMVVGLFVVGTKGDAGIQVEAEPAVVVLDEKPELEAFSAALTLELERLKAEASKLELTVEEKNNDLNVKNNLIVESEKVIEEKSQTIVSLQNAIEALQKKGVGDAEMQVAKAYARVSELEGQVERLEEHIKKQKQEHDSLEFRAQEAEKKAEEQFSKFEKMENFVAEQWIRIRQTEQALHIAEATMLKAQAEAAAKADDLMKAYGAWLPPWLVVRLVEYQAAAVSRWAQHGEPVMTLVMEKASEKAAAAQEWAKPHVEIIKTKWSPTVKKQWQQFMVAIAPHLEIVKTKTIMGYETSRDVISPQLIKARDFVEPHAQMVREFSRPYVEKVATVAQPHLDKARVVLSPYTDQVAHVYRRFLISATTYHYQASALLVLPLFGIWALYSFFFGARKKAVKPVRSSHTGHAHKKSKRRHAEKETQ